MILTSLPRRWCELVWGLLVAFSIIAGTYFRVASPDRAYVWNDEAATLFYASGHSATELDQPELLQWPLTAGALSRFMSTPDEHQTVWGSIRRALYVEVSVGPLYYALVRSAMQSHLSSHFTTRRLGAVISVLFLVAFFFLCRTLFKSNQVAWLGAALAASSPGQVFWAFESRPYGLWALAVVVSTLLLTRASHSNRWTGWAAYAMGATALLYTHPLSVGVLAAHGVAIVWIYGKRDLLCSSRFVLCMVFVALVSVPWLVVYEYRGASSTDWIWTRASLSDLLWSLRETFLRQPFASPVLSQTLLGRAALSLVSLATLLSVGRLVMPWPSSSWSRAVTSSLLLVPIGMLGSVDLVMGGHSLTTPRFMAPSVVGLLLAMTFFLRDAPAKPWKLPLYSMLILSGLYSAYESHRTRCPSGKVMTIECDRAEMVRRASDPMVIAWENLKPIASATHNLPPHTPMYVARTTRELARVVAEHGSLTLFLFLDHDWHYDLPAPPHEQIHDIGFQPVDDTLATWVREPNNTR